MSNKKENVLIFLAILLLMFSAGWLYLNSLLDYAGYNQSIKSINNIQQSSNQLVNDILLVESGGNNNFDQVGLTELRIESILADLEARKPKVKQLRVEVKLLLSNVSKVKSNYAVFLNSISYFPKSVVRVRQKLLGSGNVKLVQELNALERQVMLYSAFSANNSKESKQQITERIDSLQRKIEVGGNEAKKLASVAFRHTGVLLNYADKLHQFNEKVLNNNVSELSQAVLSIYEGEFSESIVTAKNIKSGFYITAFVLLYLVFLLWTKQNQAMRYLSENTKSLSLALTTAKQNQFSVNIQKREVKLGKAYSKALGLGSKEYRMSIEEWESHLHPDDKVAVVSLFHDCLTTGVDFIIDYRWKGRNGNWLWVSSVGRIVEYDNNGLPLKMAGISANITERKTNEEVLRIIAETSPDHQQASGESLYRTIVKELAEAKGMKYALIAKVDFGLDSMATTLAVWADGEFADNFSYSLVGTPCQEIITTDACLYPNSVQALFPDDLMLADMGVESYIGVPFKNSHNRVIGLLSILDDKPMDNKVHLEPLMLSLATRVAIEIERNEAMEQLTQMAHYDVLTRLPNRSLLSDRFLQAYAHSERTGGLLAICFIDLDEFKPVNDDHGHDVGDLLLKEVSSRLRNSIRQDDTVSRLGGDEFVLLLSELLTVEECQLTLDRVLHDVSQPYHIADKTVNITASIGFTLSSSSSDDLDALLRQADQAMYAAKTKGKNRYSRFNAELSQLQAKKHIELSEIRQGLEDKEFCLYYQPKVNMQTGVVYGAEALIRWLHPERGLVAPFGFLPIVDATKMEVAIGNWVMSEALQQMEVWEQQGINLEVSVNISSYHLLSRNFLETLEQLLASHPSVNPANFQLEILESSVIGDIDKISDILRTCRDNLRVKIALDDFGTGYSSLTHLRQLPASTVKIDRTFIRDILEDANDYAIVKAVVGLADSFGLSVIAEGVEVDEQGTMLLEIGCVNAQGFGIAKPMPADEMAQWLENYQPNQQWIREH
jgi:diguanylate cyclase (GGDEF)-like protein